MLACTQTIYIQNERCIYRQIAIAPRKIPQPKNKKEIGQRVLLPYNSKAKEIQKQ